MLTRCYQAKIGETVKTPATASFFHFPLFSPHNMSARNDINRSLVITKCSGCLRSEMILTRVYINIHAVSLVTSLESKLWKMCTSISALTRVGWTRLQRGGARILCHHQQQESDQSDVEKSVSQLAHFQRLVALLCVLVMLVRLQTLDPQTFRSANAQSCGNPSLTEAVSGSPEIRGGRTRLNFTN